MTNTITDTGNAAILQAMSSSPNLGFNLQVTSFQLGAGNTPFSSAATSLPGGTIYEGVTGQLQALPTNDPNTICYVVNLDSSVGSFVYGSIGLYLSTGQLLTYVSLAEPRTKKASNLPAVLGDVHTYYIPVTITGSNSIFTINLPSSASQSIPTVGNINNLPAPSTAVSSAYIVKINNTGNGNPLLAYTDGINWYAVGGTQII